MPSGGRARSQVVDHVKRNLDKRPTPAVLLVEGDDAGGGRAMRICGLTHAINPLGVYEPLREAVHTVAWLVAILLLGNQ
jgi:hypothetical protein